MQKTDISIEKSKKSKFLRVFLKSRYLNKNLDFPSFFPTRYDQSGSKFFYKYFNRIGVHGFFFLKMLFVRNSACVKKLVQLEKTRFLIVSSVFWFSQTIGIGTNSFQTKITRTPYLFLLVRKNLSPEKWSMSICGREGGGRAQIILALADYVLKTNLLSRSCILMTANLAHRNTMTQIKSKYSLKILKYHAAFMSQLAFCFSLTHWSCNVLMLYI